MEWVYVLAEQRRLIRRRQELVNDMARSVWDTLCGCIDASVNAYAGEFPEEPPAESNGRQPNARLVRTYRAHNRADANRKAQMMATFDPAQKTVTAVIADTGTRGREFRFEIAVNEAEEVCLRRDAEFFTPEACAAIILRPLLFPDLP